MIENIAIRFNNLLYLNESYYIIAMRKSRARTSKSKSKEHGASQELIGFVNKQFNNKVPVSFLTGLTKTYCRKPLDQNHSFVKRYSAGKFVDGQKLTDYLAQKSHHEKGKPLTE